MGGLSWKAPMLVVLYRLFLLCCIVYLLLWQAMAVRSLCGGRQQALIYKGNILEI